MQLEEFRCVKMRLNRHRGFELELLVALEGYILERDTVESPHLVARQFLKENLHVRLYKPRKTGSPSALFVSP